MAFKAIKVSCWEKFLQLNKCRFNRTKASHDIWKCPGCIKPIVFRGAKKEIPAFHIHTNLKTMRVDAADFYSWVEQNC